MNAQGVIRLVVAFGVLVAVASARGDESEEKVPLSQVPKVVMDAVKAKFPAAEFKEAVKETEDGKTFFELSLKLTGDVTCDVLVTPDGKIVEIEKSIDAKDLPAPVAATLKEKYPGAKMKRTEEVTKGTEVVYEAILVTADQKTLEVVLDKTGTIKEVEEVKDEKD
jgi:hypothetical protein